MLFDVHSKQPTATAFIYYFYLSCLRCATPAGATRLHTVVLSDSFCTWVTSGGAPAPSPAAFAPEESSSTFLRAPGADDGPNDPSGGSPRTKVSHALGSGSTMVSALRVSSMPSLGNNARQRRFAHSERASAQSRLLLSPGGEGGWRGAGAGGGGGVRTITNAVVVDYYYI